MATGSTSWAQVAAALVQTSRGESAQRGILRFFPVVVALALVAVVIAFLRRRMRRVDEPVASEFSLEQLRELWDCGELTVQEYEILRRRTIDAARRAAV